MNIINANREFNKEEMYKMTKSQTAKKLSEYPADEQLKVDDYIIFERANYDGEVTTIVSIRSENDVYVTNSPSFTNEFIDIADIFADNIPPILVVHGKSKRGREFITCALA